ncbi:SphA family protein [Halopseudomonas pertucinogena]|uniref:Transporter n=1 Tax=Halopseudomonas pertucinogena TaxID=86175 RepID=A0ABQ2CTH5_9GAMM|nr:transporter [Halopseudomonas pertucinogena]GGJ07869.1 hypothetical protein GCM10009083_25990 [Halopseudomonas pertucinogena]
MKSINRLLLALLTLAAPLSALAANGHYVPGIEATGGAFLPPAPGLYYRAYLVHYDITDVVDPSGDTLPGSNSGSVSALANRFVWVSGRKFLGADYGVETIIPVQRTTLNFKGLGVDSSESGVGDVYLGPVVLGWHGSQWDAVFAAGVWLDTAEHDARDPASIGRGHHTTMLTLGGAWHFDEQRRWSVSALSRYEIKGEQDDTHITPGDSWLVEWALTHRLESGLEVALAGFDAWQLEADSGTPSNDKLERHAAGIELGYGWRELGMELRGAVYHEYSTRAGSSGVQPEGNLFRLALTKAF